MVLFFVLCFLLVCICVFVCVMSVCVCGTLGLGSVMTVVL